MSKLARIIPVVAVLLALSGGAARAAPEGDYKDGEKAYRQGDVVKAMGLLKSAADAGHAAAQSLYAEILDRSEFNEEAVEYYRKAAAQGDAEGEFGLAGMYAAGEGVKKDPQEAMTNFVKAAERGHVQAIKVVAAAYVLGELGLDETARNGPEARKWITRAAELDHVPSVEALAKAYQSGGFGIEPDAQQATLWSDKLKLLRPERAKSRRGARK